MEIRLIPTQNDAPAVVFLDDLFKRAIAASASDIHLESAPEELQVRFRIDGLLAPQPPLEKNGGVQLLSRIKVLASLDVSERRLPQDGKLSVTVFTRNFDVRVATFPTVHGEKIVLRLLERASAHQSLDQLGFEKETYESIKSLALKASGFFLVTGPTGSGKTTTLHALLSTLTHCEKNITTLEDPVEYTIAGITQTQINPAIGFTFEKGIRSLLRADPDVIMVGEMRDRETARVALQAALTGHFVMSSLHTTDAPSALLRLLDMSIEPFLINAGLTAVLAQRLVRRLCVSCRYETEPTHEEREYIKRFSLSVNRFYKSTGCASCFMTGYRGRIGIFQMLTLSYELRALLTKQPDYTALYAQAVKEGMKSLEYDGALKVAAGLTSLSELIRVI